MADLAKQQPESTPRTIYLKDYQAPVFLVDKIDLEINLHETETVVHSRLRFRRNPASSDKSTSLQLDGSHQTLISLVLDTVPLTESDYLLEAESLTINQVPDEFELQVTSRINPQQNTALEGLYLSSGMLCTQCEAEGFRRITYFPDRPDIMSRYTVTLRANKARFPVLLSNGNLVEHGEDNDGSHWARWDDPSLKPSYLFAVVAGQLEWQTDNFQTMSGKDVTLRLYVEKENIHKCDHAMASLKQSMRWDEEKYGREYDLDIYMIVAVNDFNMGAMENKGLNVFNASCVLASAETATDADYYTIQSIIGHEYFHNWSGNRVTCRDWFQLSLKEGFTVYRDQEFSADLNSRAVKRIDDVNVLRAYQFAQDAGPMAHPVRPDQYMEISNFYTVTVYNKGAEVVRMIHQLVGDGGFRRGTDLYFERHDGQAVTTEDFVRAMEDANHIDLSQFKRWYDQAGTPELHISDAYDASQQHYTLTIKQTCPPTPKQEEKLPFHIPVAIGLLDETGQALDLQLADEDVVSGKTTRVLSVTQESQSYTFRGIAAKPVPSILRGFSAPVKVISNLSREDLAFLLANDTDAFNRWDAGQQLSLKVLLDMIASHQAGEEMNVPGMLIDAYRQTLLNRDLDPALVARILTLPGESYIADQMDSVDVDAIFAARESLKFTLASSLQNELMDVYRGCQQDGEYRFNAQDMAIRSLKNIALAYLLLLDDSRFHDMCYEQYQLAHNMTDKVAALSCLVDLDSPLRDSALNDFYQQWQNDKQVVEKWFALQAGSKLPQTLEHVKTLMQHPAFSLHNPNKVRSLIGRFCAGNLVRFHAGDGSGYRFLGDQVLALDTVNPQIAARLIQSLSRWRRFDAPRQQLMREQLERIVAQADLSKDVYEIASKSLE